MQGILKYEVSDEIFIEDKYIANQNHQMIYTLWLNEHIPALPNSI